MRFGKILSFGKTLSSSKGGKSTARRQSAEEEDSFGKKASELGKRAIAPVLDKLDAGEQAKKNVQQRAQFRIRGAMEQRLAALRLKQYGGVETPERSNVGHVASQRSERPSRIPTSPSGGDSSKRPLRPAETAGKPQDRGTEGKSPSHGRLSIEKVQKTVSGQPPTVAPAREEQRLEDSPKAAMLSQAQANLLKPELEAVLERLQDALRGLRQPPEPPERIESPEITDATPTQPILTV